MNVNSVNLEHAVEWFKGIVAGCLRVHFGKAECFEVLPLTVSDEDWWLARFVQRYNPTSEELTLLLLALVPHLQPSVFSKLIAEHLPGGGDFPEFGGVKGTNHRGLLPTGETAQFILAGDDFEKRLDVQRLLSSEHWFAQEHILWLESVREGEPMMSGRLLLNPDIVEELTLGTVSKPRFSIEFPAEHIDTDMTWEDLVLHPGTLRQIREIEHWITHNDTLLHDWGMKKRIKPGYRALFYGPPGTGKTLTATLLGKHTGKDVFRIDLSRVVSKYIGETEKNLAKVFDQAQHKGWILFFDEADALFGKRSETKDSHDRYANQEVSFLLQRIEVFDGIAILASNLRENLDEAFTRRFESIIYFPLPRPEERLRLWRQGFSPKAELARDVDLEKIAKEHALSGGAIMNVIRYASMQALERESTVIQLDTVLQGIRKEYAKEGKGG